jgi:hypothetical protein
VCRCRNHNPIIINIPYFENQKRSGKKKQEEKKEANGERRRM